MSDLVKLERILGIKIGDEAVYREALTHKSFAAEHQLSYDNQRLELLGDAVVQIILTDYLYKRYKDLQEGDLTKIRSAMVNQDALAQFARDISLGSPPRPGFTEPSLLQAELLSSQDFSGAPGLTAPSTSPCSGH